MYPREKLNNHITPELNNLSHDYYIYRQFDAMLKITFLYTKCNKMF